MVHKTLDDGCNDQHHHDQADNCRADGKDDADTSGYGQHRDGRYDVAKPLQCFHLLDQLNRLLPAGSATTASGTASTSALGASVGTTVSNGLASST